MADTIEIPTATAVETRKRVEKVEEPRQPQEPHLLGLSAELRNRIYQYSLIATNGLISIGMSDPLPEEPGLLRTCSKIRSEALAIYYAETRFYFDAQDLDVSRALQWVRMKNSAYLRAAPWPKGKANWMNLKVWLKAVWQSEPVYAVGPVNVVYPDSSNNNLARTTAGFFEMLIECREDGLTWDQALKGLERARVIAATLNPDWEV